MPHTSPKIRPMSSGIPVKQHREQHVIAVLEGEQRVALQIRDVGEVLPPLGYSRSIQPMRELWPRRAE